MLDRTEELPAYNYLARTIIDSIERLAAALHRKRIYTPAAQAADPVKVNLGSGLRVAPGWINVDGSLKTLLAGKPDFVIGLAHNFLTDRSIAREQFREILSNNTFVHHDLKYGVPMPDSSVDFIYTSHTLHHLYRDQAQKLLNDCCRALKPGGVIRIAVPDLEYIFALYGKGERERALEFFFYSSTPRHSLSSRRYQYDFEMLRMMLQAAGYDNIRRCRFGVGRTPDLDRLDNRPDQTLFVEAEKPRQTADEAAAGQARTDNGISGRNGQA